MGAQGEKPTRLGRPGEQETRRASHTELGPGGGLVQAGLPGDRSEGREREVWEHGGWGSGIPGLSQRVEHVT